jgi:signal transduction histidine kinase/ActR/RegA family two-component response regulator
MRFSCHALMLPDPDRERVSPDDPELSRLIRAERIRMLFAPTLPVAMVSAVVAVALAVLIAKRVEMSWAFAWAAVCVGAAVVRVLHLSTYVGASNRASPYWLNSLTVVCGLHGAAWGLAGLLMPVQDMVTTAVIVATLVGACAVCTFTMQAHMLPNMAMNLPMLAPAIVMLFTRQDAYGLFGGAGLMALLALMLYESRRVERRTTELLWLRFTTDRIARERAEALKLAQRHSAVKDQFLATMSHEMRTPLHGILGLARLVHNRLPARPGVLNESRHQLALIERTGEHLLGIINDVLDFSRIEAGKLQITVAPFELHTVIQDVLTLLTITATDKGLRLHTDIDLPDPCWVKGDAARVRQVLHNLIGNAIKFTDAGEVHVNVRRQDGDEMVFEIRDTGVGIPPQQLPLIFEAFHQVDSTFGRKHRGTGLGLTISREIARAMGGDIRCESTLHKGSVFALAIPLPATPVDNVDVDLPLGRGETQAARLAGNTAPAELSPKGETAHILLAEDNQVNALVAEATLANLGVQVTRVEDGQQALRELQHAHHPYDLVLMDCQMPVLDGIEATRRLRIWEREQGLAPIPVVALTANALNSDRERCMAAGMNEHLAKPFRQEELRATLQRHLPHLNGAKADPAAV